MGLRTLLVIALAAWSGWLLVRGVMRRHVPWIGLALVAVPLVVLGYTERQWTSAEQTFGTVARSIAKHAEGVHCQRFLESFTANAAELGHVDFDDGGFATGPAVLSSRACEDLAAYWRSTPAEKDSPTLDEVIAVHVLTHESVHLTGETSESMTECQAMQRDATVAQRLGATAAQARALQVEYATQVYPRMPDTYRSSECTQDSRFDLTPHDGIWP